MCLCRTVAIEHSKGSKQSACSSKGPCDLCLLNLNINKGKHRAAAVKQDSLALAQCSVIWVTCCGCTSEIVFLLYSKVPQLYIYILIHIYIHTLFQILFYYGSSQGIEYSSKSFNLGFFNFVTSNQIYFINSFLCHV